MNNSIEFKCKTMARKHGAEARLKSARLIIMLAFYESRDKLKHEWLLKRIINTGVSINRHLKHSAILGSRIKELELK
jgi:hypothetical protein